MSDFRTPAPLRIEFFLSTSTDARPNLMVTHSTLKSLFRSCFWVSSLRPWIIYNQIVNFSMWGKVASPSQWGWKFIPRKFRRKPLIWMQLRMTIEISCREARHLVTPTPTFLVERSRFKHLILLFGCFIHNYSLQFLNFLHSREFPTFSHLSRFGVIMKYVENLN